MPTVSVFEDQLQAALEGEVNQESFDKLCFDFGLELDDVTSDFDITAKERGKKVAEELGLSKRIIYKVDVPANRYDLLCLEGLVRGLRVYQGQITAPDYKLSMPRPSDPKMRITVSASTAQIRPFVVSAVLRNVTFDEGRYQSFIELQDKLHQNVCRKRSLVAIGTHDLSTLKPPFTYQALPPKDIKFRPLNVDEEMDGHRLMEFFKDHLQLKNYLPIIRDSPVYPVIHDSAGEVLSLPPIINGDLSKITLKTKDVFIECTATDLTKAKIVLNTVVAMFGEYCAKPFVVEPVEVVYADDYPGNSFVKPGDKIIYPQLAPRPMDADIKRMKTALSLDHLEGTEVRDLLRKMSVPCEVDKKDSNILRVQVPITRSDIMHECDLVEDVAIAYGYNNLKTFIPNTFSGAGEQPINHLTDLLRQEMAMAGFTECLNWALLSRKENWEQLRREPMVPELWRSVARPHEYSHGLPAVTVSNPKWIGFEIMRTSLLPGVLKTTASNKHNPTPLKIFEIGDVIVQEPTRETGAKNVRRVCAVNAGKSSDFHVTHGVLDQIMYVLGCVPKHEHKEGSRKRPFRLQPSDDPAFFPGRQAHVVVEDVAIGIIGDLHPEVVSSKGFDFNLPTSAFEVNIEPFLEWL